MVLLLIAGVYGCVGDEPCEEFDRENLLVVLQCFPHVDFVEKKIEEIQISSARMPSSFAAELAVLAFRCSEAAEESVNDGAGMKQVFQRAERCGLRRDSVRRLCGGGKVCPVGRDV